MKLKAILLAVCAFSMMLASCGSGTTEDAGSSEAGEAATCSYKKEGTLTVATGEPVFEPWMVNDDPSNGEGFESAVVYALANELGIENVEWQRTGFDEAIAVGEKPYDFNIQQYSITEEREKAVDFSTGYYQVEQVLIAAPGSPVANAKSIADLKDARLGASIGTTSLNYIEDFIKPNNAASVFNDNADAKSAFEAGQVDGIVFDLPTAYYITAVEIPEAVIAGVLPRQGDTPEELGMLFEEGSSAVSCINEALATLKSNGTLEEIENQWLNQGGSIPTLDK